MTRPTKARVRRQTAEVEKEVKMETLAAAGLCLAPLWHQEDGGKTEKIR